MPFTAKQLRLMKESADGDCYIANCQMFLEMCEKNADSPLPEIINPTLVHGYVHHAHEPIMYGHCWVEFMGLVFDFSNGNEICIPIQLYYKAGRIDEDKYTHKRYELKEVNRNLAKYKMWNCWGVEFPILNVEN